MLADRARRMHHFLWHQVRNGWFRYPEAARRAIATLGWAPPRPAVTPSGEVDLANGSGEDFLFLHRQMLVHLDQALAASSDCLSAPALAPCTEPPAPDDPDHPLPPPYTLPDGTTTHEVKSAQFYHRLLGPRGGLDGLATRHQLLTDPGNLRRVSLGAFGSILETLARDLLLRWSARPARFRPDAADADADDVAIAPRWDHPSYDWLGDPYSCLVNPDFWWIHRLIDGYVDGWARANEVDPIPWRGIWVGRLPPAPGGDGAVGVDGAPFLFAYSVSEVEDDRKAGVHAGRGALETMERVVAVIYDSGVVYRPYEPRPEPVVLNSL